MEERNRPLSCEEAVRRFFAYLDRALAGESAEALEAHLESCLDCCEKLEFNRKLDGFVRGRLGDAPLPAGVAERIRRRLAG